MTFQRIDKSTRFIEVSRRFIEVSSQLRQAIFNGEYQPGERLPSERDLTEMFGVSRMIVREAIWDLKRSGMVEIKRGVQGGAFVQDMKHNAITSIMQDLLTMTGARPSDIIEIRLLIEPLAVELAAKNATDEDIQAIQKHLQNPPEDKTPETVKWSIEFHRMVANASHNPIFSMFINILMDFTEDLILGLLIRDSWHEHSHGDHSHLEILEKISQKDAEGAKRLYYNHLLEIKTAFDSWEDQFDVDTNFFNTERKTL